MEINENVLKVLKSSFLSPEHAKALDMARDLGRDLRVVLVVQPGEYSHKPKEDGTYDAIYKVGIQRLESLEMI